MANLLQKIKKAIGRYQHKWLVNHRLVSIDANSMHIGFEVPKCDFSKYPQIQGYANVGVVLQGPLDKRENFTLNTVRMLRHIYPDIAIVLSTWYGEVGERERKDLQQMNCEIIEDNGLPTELLGEGRKVGHLNNQYLSSINGIRLLKAKGIKYALKMRTDTRIYKYDFIPYFINLLALHPSNKPKQNKRLINIAYGNTLASVPFHMCDFIWFGTIEDMEKMWSVPTRTDEAISMIRNMSDEELNRHTSKFWEKAQQFDMRDVHWLEASDEDKNVFYNFHEESYIVHQYAAMNQLCDENISPIDAYYRFLRDCVIVVSEKDVLAYFDKYEYSANRDVYATPFFLMDHSQWLDLKFHYL